VTWNVGGATLLAWNSWSENTFTVAAVPEVLAKVSWRFQVPPLAVNAASAVRPGAKFQTLSANAAWDRQNPRTTTAAIGTMRVSFIILPTI
jgi:hypothetical protein